jgi:hypothetical protein
MPVGSALRRKHLMKAQSNPMKNLRKFKEEPLGQVLLATLLFCFIFAVLFSGLYRSGTAYLQKETARRSSDLTALSSGAVYANGLQLVKYSNIILMGAATIDIANIAKALIPTLPEGLLAAPAIIKAADTHFRDKVQNLQDIFFGVDRPTGIYPLLIIESETRALARDNSLKSRPPLQPLLLFNLETSKLTQVAIPNMALRFRHMDELIPERRPSTYSLKHNGQRYFFTETQVESANNPRHPDQMRVKKDGVSPFSGFWVRRENEENESETNFLGKFIPANFSSILKEALQKIRLDVTHRSDPPNHTITLWAQLPGRVANQKTDFNQISEITVEGGGLAAWDIAEFFRVSLQKFDPAALPILKTLINLPSRSTN